MSSPGPPSSTPSPSGGPSWADRAAALKQKLIQNRQIRSTLVQPGNASSSSIASGKQQESQDQDQTDGASVSAASKMDSPQHDKPKTQDSTDDAPFKAPAITDVLTANPTGDTAASTESPTASNATPSSQSTVTVKNSSADEAVSSNAKAKMLSTNGTSRPNRSSDSAQTKPENVKSISKVGKSGAQPALEEGEVKDGPKMPKVAKMPKPPTAADAETHIKRASSKPTSAAADARQATTSRTPSKDVPIEPRADRGLSKRTTSAPEHAASRDMASHSSSPKDTRKPFPHALPHRPALRDSRSRSRSPTREPSNHHHKPHLRPYRDHQRPESPRRQLSMTAPPRAHTADVDTDPDPDYAVSYKRDLRDWLRFTGWHDAAYRRGELARQRRLDEIEQEKAELEEAAGHISVSRQQQQQHHNAPAPPNGRRGSNNAFSGSDGRRSFPVYDGPPRRAQDDWEYTKVLHDYSAAPVVAGVKRGYYESESDREPPAKYYRSAPRGQRRGGRRGSGYRQREYSYSHDEFRDRGFDRPPTLPLRFTDDRSHARLGSSTPRHWGQHSRPVGHPYERDDLRLKEFDIGYDAREPFSPRGRDDGFDGDGYAGHRRR